MKPITNTLQALVRRRLWPVALLLLAALVAVPMTLAKTPEPTAPATPVAAARTGQDEALSKSVVQLSDTKAGSKRRRRVLGQAKDPFAPAPLPKVKKKKHVAKKATATPTATATPSASAGGGATASPVATATPVPMVTLPKGSVRVRFGVTSDAALAPLIVGRLDALPSVDAPVLVLEGLKDNGKTAVFTVPGTITAVGDGNCRPAGSDCETLELRSGQTEFITVKGATTTNADGTTTTTADQQFQLDVVKIYADATRVPKSSVPQTASATG
jgi:hypothetical protein